MGLTMPSVMSAVARWLSPLLLAACVALGFATPLAAAPRPDHVTIAGLKGPTSIGMLRLMEAHPSFDGIPSRYEVVNTPDLMVARLLTGSTDFAFLPLNLAANLYAKSVPIELAATTGDGVLYLLTSRPDVHSLRDLRGRTIYDVSRGSTPEFMLDFVLEHNGIDPRRDVTIDFTFSHIELAQQMSASRIDLGVLPEPFATIALAKNRHLRVVVDLQREWEKIQGTDRPYPTSALVVRRSLAEEAPRVVSDVLSAERGSIDWVVAHPDEAGALAERHLGIPAAVIVAAMPRLNLRFAAAAQAYGEVQRFLREFFAFDPESVGGALPDSRFYLGK